MTLAQDHRFRFQDSVCVVTGGASGIGRAAALAFARAGSDVVVADLNEAGAASVGAEIEALGRRALAVQTDVAKADQLDDLVGKSIEWQGHLDLFFSNAGIAIWGPPERIPMESWEAAANVNLWPHVRILGTVLPHMLERGSGYLLHTASAGGLVGNPATAPYVMTKFAVVGLAESLAIYCAGTGVGVSVVCPMFVATNLLLTSPLPEEAEIRAEAARRREAAHQRMQEGGLSPEQVANDIVAGVMEGQLYVMSHPELREMVQGKWQNPDLWLRRMATLWRTRPWILDPMSTP